VASDKHPAENIPGRPTLQKARRAASTCQACDLWKRGTQTVFGQGSSNARLVLVGEQPGDQEDRQGLPFVGPAGRELANALATAGFDPREAYLTNAVKHFKWEPRGKRRIHKKPRMSEVLACKPWLLLEIELLKPDAIICLGTTAAQSVFGRSIKIGEVRGKPLESSLAPLVMVTTHPSSILRAPDSASRQQARAELAADFRTLAELMRERGAKRSQG
jgi:uracil-DNA glycosylase family protein